MKNNNFVTECMKNVAVMMKWKTDNRIAGGTKLLVSEDVFEGLMASGEMLHDISGVHQLYGVPVTCVLGYPNGFVCAE